MSDGLLLQVRYGILRTGTGLEEALCLFLRVKTLVEFCLELSFASFAVVCDKRADDCIVRGALKLLYLVLTVADKSDDDAL